MDRCFAGVFGDVADQCGCKHGTDVNRKGKPGFGQKIRKNSSQTDRKDQLENCGRIHIRMTFMLFFILDEQTVIFRDCGGQQVVFFNQAFAERTADQTAGNQTKGGSSSTDRGGSLNIKVF